MKLLAVDQATRVSGYSVWDDDKLIDYGKFSFDAEGTEYRCYQVACEILKLATYYEVNEVVIEDIQLQVNNVSTFQKLAQLQGAIIYALIDKNINYKILKPSEWRATCNFLKGQDKHRATQKKIAQDWVLKKFNKKCTQDEADAICIGYAAITISENELNWE